MRGEGIWGSRTQEELLREKDRGKKISQVAKKEFGIKGGEKGRGWGDSERGRRVENGMAKG